MPLVFLPDLRLNARLDGPPDGPALVLIHALGLDHQIWQPLIQALPRHRILSFDLRGHGASDCPPPPYKMGSLIQDTERLMDHFGLQDSVVIGLSLGGLIAQGLAVKRLDLVRGLVLSNTAARIGTAAQWQQRIDLVREGGMAALHDATMERWLGRNWRQNPALPGLSARFLATRPEGWIGAASAIAGTDFYETTATLRLPTLVIAGGHDGATPADLIRETADLIPGHQFSLMRDAGHIPVAEQPEAYVTVIQDFLNRIGHV
ncbi:3-oxoadipate enol-lactonase [Xinfangfangia sp. D13-10-4-6]|uniref:3-oxoadipate enol-lactonase n=1 Tax=Pseudogemmobacter hezensis TaxID=2737662 RepID=UPI001554F0EC|nr:3-oxoadipate enol-lactonase [Pseudogemmobacter hezensis]NPD13810.1 3-oxoadipate enol-lactonase [Pseudogemmobacter hezensis]